VTNAFELTAQQLEGADALAIAHLQRVEVGYL
jgi:hypothetical protein